MSRPIAVGSDEERLRQLVRDAHTATQDLLDAERRVATLVDQTSRLVADHAGIKRWIEETIALVRADLDRVHRETRAACNAANERSASTINEAMAILDRNLNRALRARRDLYGEVTGLDLESMIAKGPRLRPSEPSAGG